MGISTTLEELLSFKVIATLRDMRTNKTKQQNDERVKQRIYDKSHIFNKRRQGKSKNI